MVLCPPQHLSRLSNSMDNSSSNPAVVKDITIWPINSNSNNINNSSSLAMVNNPNRDMDQALALVLAHKVAMANNLKVETLIISEI